MFVIIIIMIIVIIGVVAAAAVVDVIIYTDPRTYIYVGPYLTSNVCSVCVLAERLLVPLAAGPSTVPYLEWGRGRIDSSCALVAEYLGVPPGGLGRNILQN